MAFTTRKRSPDLDPRTSQQSLFLLDLPDELLLKIAGSIPDPEDLCQLSLACKKLKHVAQETLVKEVLLPPKGMPYLIRTLCDRPDLCGKITSVDLDDYQHTGSANLLESPDSRSRLETWSYFSRCRQLIGNDAFDKVGRYDLRDFTSPLLWSKEHRFFLAILVAACSNITELSLRLPPASQDRQLQVALGDQEAVLVNPFPGILRCILRKQLRVLEIRETDSLQLFKTPSVTISCLLNLERLSIPADSLICIARQSTSVHRVLPRNLQHLQLNPCNRFIVLWLPELATACLTGVLHKLYRIDLHFPACLRDSLTLIDQGRGSLHTLRDVVGLLARSRSIEFRGYNSSGAYTGDLLEELDAWSLLSDTERWLPTEEETEFSYIVARTPEGTPRRRTTGEVREFVTWEQTSRPSARTVSNFMFCPKIDIRGTAILSFFTSTEYLPEAGMSKFTSDFTRWSSSVAATQRMAEPTLRSTLAYHLTQQAPETKSQFQAPNNRCSYRFDPNEWLGVDFFENMPSEGSERITQPDNSNSRETKHTLATPAHGDGEARHVRRKI